MSDLEMIKDYIDSGNVSETERRFLNDYMVNMRRSESERCEIDLESVTDDVRKLNTYLQGVEDTSLVKARINQELDILNILVGATGDDNKLLEASYRLDQLYYESDMPFRNTDTVIRKVKESQNQVGRGAK